MSKNCKTDKTCYQTKLDADIALYHLKRRDKFDYIDHHVKAAKRSYYCQFCHYWHLTSQDKYY